MEFFIPRVKIDFFKKVNFGKPKLRFEGTHKVFGERKGKRLMRNLTKKIELMFLFFHKNKDISEM